jgi:hypothetical protein
MTATVWPVGEISVTSVLALRLLPVNLPFSDSFLPSAGS